jgi:hypothetical protein
MGGWFAMERLKITLSEQKKKFGFSFVCLFAVLGIQKIF